MTDERNFKNARETSRKQMKNYSTLYKTKN